jgi:hypothetical protein
MVEASFSTSLQHTSESVPPTGFVFNPDMLESYEEQVETAHRKAAYQAEPIPSFEDVPTVDVTPAFNPSDASEEEIYARGRVPESLRRLGEATHAELTGNSEPVEMWRIVERKRLKDGSGLASSRVLYDRTLGKVEEFDAVKHLASNHERRVADPGAATPFVSFSTDPRSLAERVILRHGFGVKGGRDSVVVKVQVDPSRVITRGEQKESEVLLIGGVAPEEYVAAYEVSDFVARLVPNEAVSTLHGSMSRDEALNHWFAEHVPPPSELA